MLRGEVYPPSIIQDGGWHRYGANFFCYTSVAYRPSCDGPESMPTSGAQSSPAPSASDKPREWHAVIRDFLSAAGLTQALRGFDADMVMMNPGFERNVVPGALDGLLDSLVVSCASRLTALATHCVS